MSEEEEYNNFASELEYVQYNVTTFKNGLVRPRLYYRSVATFDVVLLFLHGSITEMDSNSHFEIIADESWYAKEELRKHPYAISSFVFAPEYAGVGSTMFTAHQQWHNKAAEKAECESFLAAMADLLKNRTAEKIPLVIYGHSQGGGFAHPCHMVAQTMPEFDLLVTVGSAGVYYPSIYVAGVEEYEAFLDHPSFVASVVDAESTYPVVYQAHAYLASKLIQTTFRTSKEAENVSLEFSPNSLLDASIPYDNYTVLNAFKYEMFYVKNYSSGLEVVDDVCYWFSNTSCNNLRNKSSPERVALDAHADLEKREVLFPKLQYQNNVPFYAAFSCYEFGALCDHSFSLEQEYENVILLDYTSLSFPMDLNDVLKDNAHSKTKYLARSDFALLVDQKLNPSKPEDQSSTDYGLIIGVSVAVVSVIVLVTALVYCVAKRKRHGHNASQMRLLHKPTALSFSELNQKYLRTGSDLRV